MALAIIGGEPRRFTPFVDLFRESAARAGLAPPPVGINSHTFVAAARGRPPTSSSRRTPR
jgi:hypothetical protein